MFWIAIVRSYCVRYTCVNKPSAEQTIVSETFCFNFMCERKHGWFVVSLDARINAIQLNNFENYKFQPTYKQANADLVM